MWISEVSRADEVVGRNQKHPCKLKVRLDARHNAKYLTGDRNYWSVDMTVGQSRGWDAEDWWKPEVKEGKVDKNEKSRRSGILLSCSTRRKRKNE